MDFTMNMMENSRNISASQAAPVAAMGNVAVYPAHQGHQSSTHAVSISQNQQQTQHHALAAAAAAVVQHPRNNMQEDNGVSLSSDAKLQELSKEDSEETTFTPPPRVSSVSSVSQQDTRAEKGTDTTDFEPVIKIEIRGGIPGLNLGSEKDKNNVIQLHFNSPAEVLHYFSQRSVPQLDAFNLLSNPDLVRNINPDLVRNHFLYVPNSQDGVRVSSNGFSSTSPQSTPIQGGPVIVTGPNGAPKTIKQERRRGELPQGTIIHRNVQLEALPNQYVCWICGLDLQKSLPFEEHMVDQHSVDKPYKCDDCGVTFKRKAHLDRHRRIHLPIRPYQCGVCGKGFTRNEHVRRHAFTHSGEKPFNCPTCGKTFSRREHLSKHLVSHTKPGHLSPSQIGHPQSTGEYDEFMYSPAESPTILPPLTQQQQQMMLQSQDGSLSLNPSLMQHFSQISVSQSSSSGVGVNMTKQRQNAQPGLTTTLLLQTTDQNGRIVTINQAAQGGQVSGAIVGSSSGSGPIQSYHGNSSSSTVTSGSGQHQGRQQNGEPVARPYQCGVCGKAFIRNEHLRRHVLTHSGEKPHVCSLCGKAFSRREHLTKHLRSHAVKASVAASQSAPSTPTPSHSSIPTAVTPGITSSQAILPGSSMGPAGAAIATSSTGVMVTQSAAGINTPAPAPAHSQSVAHSMASSHSGPVAHLPPGTHYLPMFSLLAEVV